MKRLNFKNFSAAIKDWSINFLAKLSKRSYSIRSLFIRLAVITYMSFTILFYVILLYSIYLSWISRQYKNHEYIIVYTHLYSFYFLSFTYFHKYLHFIFTRRISIPNFSKEFFLSILKLARGLGPTHNQYAYRVP